MGSTIDGVSTTAREDMNLELKTGSLMGWIIRCAIDFIVDCFMTLRTGDMQF